MKPTHDKTDQIVHFSPLFGVCFLSPRNLTGRFLLSCSLPRLVDHPGAGVLHGDGRLPVLFRGVRGVPLPEPVSRPFRVEGPVGNTSWRLQNNVFARVQRGSFGSPFLRCGRAVENAPVLPICESSSRLETANRLSKG